MSESVAGWLGGIRSSREILVASIALSLALTGCQTPNNRAQSKPTPARLFAVNVDSADFFRHGPQQGRDPDLKLPKDTIVKLIRPSFGYSKIQVIGSGLQGYVASEEIGPASSALLAAVNTPAPEPRVVQHEQFKLNSTDPRLMTPPEHLPDPDLPPPAESPP